MNERMNSPAPAETSPEQANAPAAAPLRPPLVDSTALMQGHRSIEILHNGEIYRLQSTRAGKLILTK